MLEGFVFTVYVCQEMLRSFRQIQDSLQINNFRTCIGNSRKTPGKQLQVAEIANYAFRELYYFEQSLCVLFNYLQYAIYQTYRFSL